MLFFKMPDGSKLRVPLVGQTVQVCYRNRPEWMWLPAIVSGNATLDEDGPKLIVMVINPFTFPGKLHAERGVNHVHFGGDVMWRPIPEA